MNAEEFEMNRTPRAKSPMPEIDSQQFERNVAEVLEPVANRTERDETPRTP